MRDEDTVNKSKLRSVNAFLLFAPVLLGACDTISRLRPPLRAQLRTDSTQMSVHFNGHGYAANIGFEFLNTTSDTISILGCGGPGFPAVEKLVDGVWTDAYERFSPACRLVPDFALPSGRAFRGVIPFSAAARGERVESRLLVDSINGVYRLHWIWTAGAKADARNARRVEAVSNQFRMFQILSPAVSSH
jgi:hypothetical protein